MSAHRVLVPVRMTPEQRQQVALTARRLGLTTNDYVLMCALGDTRTRAEINTIADRVESAIRSDAADRDAAMGEALERFTERVGELVHTVSNTQGAATVNRSGFSGGCLV